MQKTYIDTVRLLLDAAPEVFRGGVFAMKGGTAINLFVHGMPRLSVDIDLVYPDWSASRADALRAIADELAAIAERLQRIGLSARSVRAEGLGESKLLVGRVGRGESGEDTLRCATAPQASTAARRSTAAQLQSGRAARVVGEPWAEPRAVGRGRRAQWTGIHRADDPRSHGRHPARLHPIRSRRRSGPAARRSGCSR